MKSKAVSAGARAFGRIGGLKPKNFSPEELERRRLRLAAARAKRWTRGTKGSAQAKASSESTTRPLEPGRRAVAKAEQPLKCTKTGGKRQIRNQ